MIIIIIIKKITFRRAAIRIYCIKTYMAVILPGSSYVYIDIQSLSTEYNTGMIVPMKIILG